MEFLCELCGQVCYLVQTKVLNTFNILQAACIFFKAKLLNKITHLLGPCGYFFGEKKEIDATSNA